MKNTIHASGACDSLRLKLLALLYDIDHQKSYKGRCAWEVQSDNKAGLVDTEDALYLQTRQAGPGMRSWSMSKGVWLYVKPFYKGRKLYGFLITSLEKQSPSKMGSKR